MSKEYDDLVTDLKEYQAAKLQAAVARYAPKLWTVAPEPVGPRYGFARHIIAETARFYGLNLKQLRKTNRRRHIAWPRHVCTYLLVRHARYSYREAARLVGPHDHTTAMNSVRQVEKAIATSPGSAAEVEHLRRAVGTLLPVAA